jgi:hypothetical protein
MGFVCPVADSIKFLSLGSDHVGALPSKSQIFTYREGKQVFSISHIVCENGLGIVSQPYHLGKLLLVTFTMTVIKFLTETT